MSADNFYVIRKHPLGGFAAVMGFASDEDDPLDVDSEHDDAFPTVAAALAWASEQYSEYGVTLHAEVNLGPTREDEIAAALDFLLRDLERRGQAAKDEAGNENTLAAAALRGKANGYREARDAIAAAMSGHRIRRRWQRVHEEASSGS